jgi:hypothetical protein
MSPNSRSSRSCRHYIGGACTNPVALPIYGEKPSRGVCRACEHYQGPPRGLGDAVHAVLRVLGIEKAVKKREVVTGRSCGCGARRQRLNEIAPNPFKPS